MTPAVFLDRDGTIMEEVHYCKDPAQVRLIPGALEALRRLKAAGFLLVIVTNQSGIARGLLTQSDYAAVDARLSELLGSGLIDSTYMCPDGPGSESKYRKPAPGMLHLAEKELGIDLARSWMVGDKESDLLAGMNAGTRTILVDTGHGRDESDEYAHFVATDLASAAEFILRGSGAS